MSAAVLISEARAAGLRLQLVASNRLKWTCNGLPPPILLTHIKAAKADVLAALRAEQSVIDAQDAADRAYEFEERAAIMEFDGGMSRNEAEAAAREALGYANIR